MAHSPGADLIVDAASELLGVISDIGNADLATLLELTNAGFLDPTIAPTIADTNSGAANMQTITVGGPFSMLGDPAALAE